MRGSSRLLTVSCFFLLSQASALQVCAFAHIPSYVSSSVAVFRRFQEPSSSPLWDNRLSFSDRRLKYVSISASKDDKDTLRAGRGIDRLGMDALRTELIMLKAHPKIVPAVQQLARAKAATTSALGSIGAEATRLAATVALAATILGQTWVAIWFATIMAAWISALLAGTFAIRAFVSVAGLVNSSKEPSSSPRTHSEMKASRLQRVTEISMLGKLAVTSRSKKVEMFGRRKRVEQLSRRERAANLSRAFLEKNLARLSSIRWADHSKT